MTATLAICPLYAGFCGICIADGPHVLYAQSHAVGTLTETPDSDRTHRRDVTHADVFSLNDLVRSLCQTHGVTELVIERAVDPGPKQKGDGVNAGRSQWIADVIADWARVAGLECRVVPSTWRRGSSKERMGSLLAGYSDWPESATYQVIRAAGALLMFAGGAKLPAAPKRRRGDTSPARKKEVTDAPLDAPVAGGNPSPATAGGETDTAPGSGGPFTPPAPAITYRGRADRVAGIDPGSRYVGVCIAEGTAPPLRALYVATFEIGEQVALAKPKTHTREDGRSWEQTHRHKVLPAHVVGAGAHVLALLDEWDVGTVVVEAIENAWLPDISPAAKMAMTHALIVTGKVEQQIAALAVASGRRVLHVQRATWAGKVAPRKRGTVGGASSDARVAEAVRAGFVGWSGDEHAADAAAVCLWHMIPAEVVVPREKRVAGAKVPGGARTRWNAKARRELVAKRREDGCTCPPEKGKGRHPRDCPVAVATKARRQAKLGMVEVRV